MYQRVKSQKNDLTAHLLMKKNSRDTDYLFPDQSAEIVIIETSPFLKGKCTIDSQVRYRFGETPDSPNVNRLK